MQKIILLSLFVCFSGASNAAFLPDSQREELVALVLQNFWGKAKLSNGQFAQPASESERTTIPVSQVVVARALDAGEISGLAEWCKLDWNANYATLTKGARNKGFNDKQVAFVSILHGAAQGRIAATMSKSGACSDQDRSKIDQLIFQSKGQGL